MPPSDRAGQPAKPADLVDVAAAGHRVLHRAPRPGEPGAAGRVRHVRAPRVGASSTRSTRTTSSRPARRSASTARGQGTDGPLFLGRDTHALSEPAWATALEVFAANDVTVLIDAGDGYTPTPAVSHAILAYNRGRRRPGWPTASWSRRRTTRPRDGGFKYNPPNGGPADTDVTGWIQDRANELLARRPARASAGSRTPGPAPPTPPARTTSSAPTSTTCRAVLDLDAIRDGRRADRRRPARRRQRRLLGRDRRAARPGPDRGQPARRPDLAVHDAGLGRQDPDGLLVAVRDGLADRAQGRRTRSPPATTPTPTGTASSPPTAGLMNPNHYLAVAIALPVRAPARLAGRTPRSARRWCQLVDDRPGRRRPGPAAGRGAGRLQVVRARAARRLGRLRRRGERGRLVPAPRRQRLDHRQGRHPAGLLASEITAVTGRTPGEHYADLTAQFGDPAYARVDAPADPRAEGGAGQAVARTQVTATELAGEPITAKLTTAPGNGAAIGGLKVTDRARPGSRPARPAPRTSTRSTPSPSAAPTTWPRSRTRPARSSTRPWAPDP